MKHKYTTQVENEIEVELPLYFKVNEFDGYFSIKENQVIVIWGNTGVNISNFPEVYLKFLNDKSYEAITEAEFKTKLIQECNNLISKS